VAGDGDESWTHPPVSTKSTSAREMMTRKAFFMSRNLNLYGLILLSVPVFLFENGDATMLLKTEGKI